MLADAIPYSSENATVDILIGSDYFWDIVELSDRISLPSGLYLVPSRLGYILTGRCAAEDSTKCAGKRPQSHRVGTL